MSILLLIYIHDPKLPKSLNSARWKQGHNPGMWFVSTSISHQCGKPILEVMSKSQHRPIEIKIKAAV